MKVDIDGDGRFTKRLDRDDWSHLSLAFQRVSSFAKQLSGGATQGTIGGPAMDDRRGAYTEERPSFDFE